jgi:hypothetical protein
MEPFGCLLLGFAIAVPAAWAIDAIVRGGEPRLSVGGNERLRRRWSMPVSSCDPEAAGEYFAASPHRLPVEPARFLSVTDLLSVLGGVHNDGAAPTVRFDTEGGFIDKTL